MPKTKLRYTTFRKLRALKAKSVGFQSWNNFFEYLTRDVALEPNLHERVAEGSKRNLLQLWMQNYADNFINIRYGDEASANIPENYQQNSIIDIVTPEPAVEGTPFYNEANAKSIHIMKDGTKVANPPAGSAIVVGRGPSLFQYDHLKLLADAIKDGEYKGMVIASDGALIPCLEANILPDAVVTVDGSPIIKKYFDHHLVKTFGYQIKWITCVTAHRNTYLTARSAGMNATWFMPQFDDDRQNESWTRLQRLQSASKKFPLGVPAMNTGGNAGAAAWVAAMMLFHRSPIAFIGTDMGYPDGMPIEKTQYYERILQEAGGDNSLLTDGYPRYYHPTFKKWAYVDFIFNHYRLALIELQQATPLWYRLYGGTYNCSEQGTLFGEGIKCCTFKEFLEKHKK